MTTLLTSHLSSEKIRDRSFEAERLLCELINSKGKIWDDNCPKILADMVYYGKKLANVMEDIEDIREIVEERICARFESDKNDSTDSETLPNPQPDT